MSIPETRDWDCERPKVSIGLPVYNGENYLTEALVSLLSQSYEDFEIIISDNASEDGTRQICEYFASLDKRILYTRNESNIGAIANYNRVFQLANGEYFKWAAHDDICSKQFIEDCVEQLDKDDSIVLCFAKEIAIDKNGDCIPKYMNKYKALFKQESKDCHLRFHDLVCLNHGCFQLFGLIRTSFLRQTKLIGSFIGADRVLLSELSLHGRFWASFEPIYFRRHSEQYCALKTQKERNDWNDPDSNDVSASILIRQFKEYIRSVRRSHLSSFNRLKCYLVMVIWLGKKRKRLVSELFNHINGWSNSKFGNDANKINAE